MKALRASILAGLVCFVPGQAFAWDYLEHAWLTDYSCHHAQEMLAERLEAEFDPDLAARYVALGVACPADWQKPYCKDGRKEAVSAINHLSPEDLEDGVHPMSLGDYSAFGDHVSRFGPVPGMPNAREHGLIHHTLMWMVYDGAAGGTLETVAETACDTEVAEFEQNQAQVNAALKDFKARGEWPEIPHKLLHPGIRAAPELGPQDPSAAFSFYNPHYLDLVLRNHTHFGDLAYSAWTGFHSAALEVSGRTCEASLDYSAEELEDLIEDIAGFQEDVWESLSPAGQVSEACRLLNHALSQRIDAWIQRAPASKSDPVKEYLAQGVPKEVLPALLGLVLEASGLHYLQDGLASGHMRTVRSRESLIEVRHDHDNDNLEGVVAVMDTRHQRHSYWAFGDKFLLGPPNSMPCLMDWDTLDRVLYPIPEMLTTCTLQHQRGILAASTTASLVDWALGGPVYEESGACGPVATAEGFICRALPVRATLVSGLQGSRMEPEPLVHGTIPVPPRDYAYESLSIRAGLEIPSNVLQLGVSITFLEQLDYMGHFLTSWRAGLSTTLGEGNENQWVADYAYQFHFRLSARFMFDAAPFVFAGLRNIDDVDFFAGVGPSFGITALPEGWINLPLEIGLTYRLPLVMFSSENGFFSATDIIDGHWIQFGIGLAYSH